MRICDSRFPNYDINPFLALDVTFNWIPRINYLFSTSLIYTIFSVLNQSTWTSPLPNERNRIYHWWRATLTNINFVTSRPSRSSFLIWFVQNVDQIAKYRFLKIRKLITICLHLLLTILNRYEFYQCAWTNPACFQT